MIILCAENLATSQATITTIKSGMKKDANVTLLSVETLEEAAVRPEMFPESKKKSAISKERNLRPVLLLVQITSAKHKTILIYPQGEPHH